MIGCLLRDIGQQGVGAAEGDHGQFAEEDCDLAEHAGPAQSDDDCDDRNKPDWRARSRGRAAEYARACVIGDAVAEHAFDRGLRFAAMGQGGKLLAVEAHADQADKSGRHHDDGKRDRKKEDRKKAMPAIAYTTEFQSARRATGITASMTMASTADFSGFTLLSAVYLGEGARACFLPP